MPCRGRKASQGGPNNRNRQLMGAQPARESVRRQKLRSTLGTARRREVLPRSPTRAPDGTNAGASWRARLPNGTVARPYRTDSRNTATRSGQGSPGSGLARCDEHHDANAPRCPGTRGARQASQRQVADRRQTDAATRLQPSPITSGPSWTHLLGRSVGAPLLGFVG
jgi:hypothetical protein